MFVSLAEFTVYARFAVGQSCCLRVQGLEVDVHGLADGLKALVEAGLAKAAGQSNTFFHVLSTGHTTDCPCCPQCLPAFQALPAHVTAGQ